MKNIILFFMAIYFINISNLHADNDFNYRYQESKKNLISSHVQHTKYSIDLKCEKLNIKIKKKESNLSQLESCKDEIDPDDYQRYSEELVKSIEKCRSKIEALQSLKDSIDTVNFISFCE